jgi:uncharacterized protein (TIGR02147 family)
MGRSVMSHAVTSLTGELKSLVVALPSVLDYHDYRSYLRDVLQTRQRQDKNYTIAKFAKAIGFSSHSGLAMVLSGKRDLSSSYVDRCVRNLGLSGKQRLYFESLVRVSEQPAASRIAVLKELEFHNTQWNPPAVTEGFRLVDFFLVQQILSLYRDYISIPQIQTHFRYAIKKEEVEMILDWMLARGLVERMGQLYKVQKSRLVVEDEIPHSSGKQLHRDCLKFAAASLDDDPLDDREFQTYLMTVDSSRFPEMKRKIKKMVMDIFSEFETELDSDTVIQFHFNLFQIAKKRSQTREIGNA